jgi:hypothetical protein
MKNRIKQLLPYLLLLGLTLIFLHKLLSLEPITVGNVEDHLRLLYPYHSYDAESLKSFQIPLWNSYSLSGFPYLAGMRAHIFYPTIFMFLAIPAHLGMNLSLIIHVFLAGSFMFLFARVLGLDRFSSLVSALAFMFSGYFIDELWWGHEERLSGLIWAPAIFALFIKATKECKPVYAVWSGVAFAMAMFSGHLQVPYYTLFALFLYALSLVSIHLIKAEKKAAITSAICFLTVTAVGLGLAAIQILPALELSRYSIRDPSQDSFSFFARWSMHYSYILTFLFPRMSVIGQKSFAFPAALGYIGVLPLLFAGVSLACRKNRQILFWILLLAASIVLAMGKFTPIYGILYRYFPAFSAFRNPIFFTYLYVFAAAVLSGFGAQTVRSYFHNRAQASLFGTEHRWASSLVLISAACLVVSCLFFSSLGPKLFSLLHIPVAPHIFAALRPALTYDCAAIGLSVLTAIILFVLGERHRAAQTFFHCGILCILFADLAIYGSRFIETYNLEPFVSKQKYMEFLHQEPQPFRVLPILDYPEQDAALKLNKIASVNGYGSLEILQDYVDFIGAFQKEPVTQEATIVRVANIDSRAVDLLNTKYIIANRELTSRKLELVYEDRIPAAKTWDPHRKDTVPVKVYKNRDALPRAYIAHSFELFSDRRRMLPAIRDSRYDMENVVFLEQTPDQPPAEPEPGRICNDQVSFVKYTDNELIVCATVERDGYLVLSEPYFPGWSAFVDNVETRIFRANYLFRAVPLRSGTHLVRFAYRPLSFRIGAILSASTLLLIAGLLICKCFAAGRGKPAENI